MNMRVVLIITAAANLMHPSVFASDVSSEQLRSSAERLSSPAIEFDCKVADPLLKIGSLKYSIGGRRSFILPRAIDDEEHSSAALRLTKGTLTVLSDDLGALRNVRFENIEFNSGHYGYLDLVSKQGERLRLEIYQVTGVSSKLYIRSATGEARLSGFCNFTEKKQLQLSESEVSDWFRNNSNNRDAALQNSTEALPKPDMPGRPMRVKPTQIISQTPDSITRPLHNYRCVTISSSLTSGNLNFRRSGGRGYTKPAQNSYPELVTTTPEKMIIDRDDLKVFKGKFPFKRDHGGWSESVPYNLYYNLAGHSWYFYWTPDSYGSKPGDPNIAAKTVLIFEMRQAPQNKAADNSVDLQQNYLAVCERVATPQKSLTPSEVSEELWR